LCVAGPAEALVALWTVRGDVDEIAELAPLDVALELIQQRMVAMELADFRKRRGEHARGHVLDRRLGEVPADLRELKAMKREAWFEHFAVRISGTRVQIGGGG